MSDDIKCVVEGCDHEAEVEVERQNNSLWLCANHHKVFINVHITHESHSHSYDIDVSAFASFIESYPDLIVLIQSDIGQWNTTSSWGIIRMLNAFREQTLPAFTEVTR